MNGNCRLNDPREMGYLKQCWKKKKILGTQFRLDLQKYVVFFFLYYKRLLFKIALTLSLLVTTQEAFVDSVDQDQTAQNVQSDL